MLTSVGIVNGYTIEVTLELYPRIATDTVFLIQLFSVSISFAPCVKVGTHEDDHLVLLG